MAQVFHDRCKVGNAIPLLQEGSAGRTSKPEWHSSVQFWSLGDQKAMRLTQANLKLSNQGLRSDAEPSVALL